jgi:anti-sigma-K factor RskA
MEKDKEKKFTEYLDRVLAGEEISTGKEVDDDLRTTLEFARVMLSDRDEPSPEFKANLRDSLLQKLAARERASSASGRTKFADWLRQLSPQQPVWRYIATTALVLLLIVAGTFWYNRAASPAQVALSPQSLPVGDYSVQLPARVAPERISFSVKTTLSDTVEQSNVYRVAAPDVTAESVTSLGRRLGLSGEAEQINGGEKLRMIENAGEDSRELVVWTTSGAIEYGFVSPEKLNPLDSPSLPSMDESKRIAYSFLERVGLVPPGYRSFFRIRNDIMVIPGGSYSITDRNTGRVMQKDPTYWIVNFPYYVQGTLATGPGARIEVRIGNKGEILQLIWAWRELAPVYSGKTMSEASAFNDLASGKGSLEIPLTCDQVIVEQVNRSYWINPPSERQDYALPVYVFRGECLDSSGQHLENFTAWAEALIKTY